MVLCLSKNLNCKAQETCNCDDEIQEFINEIAEDCRDLGLENDLYPSVMIAQALLESQYGTSLLGSDPYYNLFGIKGDYNGNFVSFYTYEYNQDGEKIRVLANFRNYSNYRESLEDYVDLLTVKMDDYYSGARMSNTKNAEEAALFLQGKYATDIDYASKIMYYIDTYHLRKYDIKREDYILMHLDFNLA